MVYINHFFFNAFNQLRNFYLNSNFYDQKISKTENRDLIYKPSPYLLSSLIKYQKKKFKVTLRHMTIFCVIGDVPGSAPQSAHKGHKPELLHNPYQNEQKHFGRCKRQV